MRRRRRGSYSSKRSWHERNQQSNSDKCQLLATQLCLSQSLWSILSTADDNQPVQAWLALRELPRRFIAWNTHDTLTDIIGSSSNTHHLIWLKLLVTDFRMESPHLQTCTHSAINSLTTKTYSYSSAPASARGNVFIAHRGSNAAHVQ